MSSLLNIAVYLYLSKPGRRVFTWVQIAELSLFVGIAWGTRN